MKPTSLLIPALGLFASCAIGAPVLERSSADIHRGEAHSEGVITFPDVSKRDEGTVEGIVAGVDGTVDEIVKEVDGTVDEIVKDVDGAVDEVVTDVDGAVDGIGAAVRRRGEEHSEGVITFPDVSKRQIIH